MRWLSSASRQPPRRLLDLVCIFLGSLFLLLSTVSAQAADKKCAADYFVHSLPGAPEPLLKMHAGHVEITPEHHGNMFFWLFHNRHVADKQRLVIWLNGGPGCSSEDGALMEIGPYRVREGGKLAYNNGSWDEFANLLFVDNPVGTGFSYVDTDSYLTELEDMAKQFVAFLEKWFELFPDFSHDDIYFAGESYAGQHIPHIAEAILDRNKQSAKPWNLKGLLIGNGWISGPDQYPAYLQFAYEKGLLKAGTQESRVIEAKQNACTQVLSDGGKDRVDVPECEAILSEILFQTSTGDGNSRMCYNMYDVRLKDKHPSCGMSWPPDLEQVTPYLRRPDVTAALHIDNAKQRAGWTECNGAVGGAFRARASTPAVKLLPDILKEIPIILFSGDQDLICNHLGTEELIHNLEWNNGKGFEISPGTWAPRRAWTVASESAGFYQEARNLTYVLFYNSSHMVPFDHPRRTRAMLDRFMGVDIANIGGPPALSLIDGDEDPQTSVGGTPNSTLAHQETDDKIKDAEWKAYRKSGEVALVIVAIAAGAWGFFVWRARRRRAGYAGVWTRDPDEEAGAGLMLNGLRNGLRGKSARRNGDIEAADFDENELEDLGEGSSLDSSPKARHEEKGGIEDRERFSLGVDSDEEEEASGTKRAPG
ncbi:carboxypeptidase B-like-like protein [Microthyrium microscopicum]|uniref:Pheromone-processing carboxypeptidase KEX1 n=1 Tax=Microthyrium microscopicum TaxID=703497 RepID=A0A6A6UNX3_9PEZI|nr:carboxypeptidase B-like-like protein [Microthyrium microscopicum]